MFKSASKSIKDIFISRFVKLSFGTILIIFFNCNCNSKWPEIINEKEIIFEENFSDTGDWILNADTLCHALITDDKLDLFALGVYENNGSASAKLNLWSYNLTGDLIIKINFIKYNMSSGLWDHHNLNNTFYISFDNFVFETTDRNPYHDGDLYFENKTLCIELSGKNETFNTYFEGENENLDHFFRVREIDDPDYYIMFKTTVKNSYSMPNWSDGIAKIKSIVISSNE